MGNQLCTKKRFRFVSVGLIWILLLGTTQIQAQDWANLTKYHKLNETAVKNADAVFMGNSITEVWGHNDPAFFTDHQFICRGISGQTTPQMLLRFREDVLQLHPKTVVILAGINDIAENTGPIEVETIFGYIKSMVELAQLYQIEPVLCTLTPANKFRWRERIEPVQKIAQLNQLIKEYATQQNLVLVDYFSALVDHHNGLPPELSSDGVHLNSKGYEIMKPLVIAGIQKAIAKK